ncbi:MAG TPA: hypothetical protein VHG92_11395 [Afifellaceae bacterium]|nr:hypothetical protein [Afifellaceae bacterium]
MTAGAERPVVLATGFGPFPGAPENPTRDLVESLRSGWGERRGELHTAVLPTRYHAAREMVLRLHRRLRPDIAVHFGFSFRATGFMLERTAENRVMPGRLDAAGARPARGRIHEAGPLACPSALPLDPIHGALRERGLPVAYSGNAGGYVCNLVFYAAAARRRPTLTGFVHIPLASEMRARPSQRARAGRHLVTLSRANLIDGARVILDTCVAEWQVASRRHKKEPPRGGGPVI